VISARVAARPAALFASTLAGLLSVLVLLPLTAHADPAPSRAQVERKVHELQEQMEVATEQYHQARDAIDTSLRREAQLAAKAERLQADVRIRERRVADLAAAAYRGSDMSMLTAVMTSGSPQTFVDQMTTLDVLDRTGRTELQRLVQAREALSAQQRAIAGEVRVRRQQAAVIADRRTKIERDLAVWRQLRARLVARASRTEHRPQPSAAATSGAGSGNVSGSVQGSGRARTAVAFAYAQLGKPYQWGSDGPGSYDCSGLTQASWRAAGVSMPHSARGQYNAFPRVSLSALAPGDLIYYNGHIAIYVGGGMIIHASTPGTPVSKVPVRGGGRPIGAVRPS